MILKPLSKEAQDARKPMPPDMWMLAKNGRVHRDIGRGRAAKTIPRRILLADDVELNPATITPGKS